MSEPPKEYEYESDPLRPADIVELGREPQGPPLLYPGPRVPKKLVSKSKRSKAAKQWKRKPRVRKLAAFLELVTDAGWKVQSRGWPHFLCWKDGDIALAYPLQPGRKLRKTQLFMAYHFSKRGIPVYTWNETQGFMIFDPPTFMGQYKELAYSQDPRKIPEFPPSLGQAVAKPTDWTY